MSILSQFATDVPPTPLSFFGSKPVGSIKLVRTNQESPIKPELRGEISSFFSTPSQLQYKLVYLDPENDRDFEPTWGGFDLGFAEWGVYTFRGCQVQKPEERAQCLLTFTDSIHHNKMVVLGRSSVVNGPDLQGPAKWAEKLINRHLKSS